MFKTVIKIAVVVLLIKELWLLLQVPSVADAVFSFVMIGEVPGTDTTLTPDQVMWLLGGIFVVASSLIFRRELANLLFYRFRRPKTLLEPLQPVMPIAPPVQAAVPTTAKISRRKVLFSIAPVMARLQPAAATAKRLAAYRMAQAKSFMLEAAAKAWDITVLALGYAWKFLLVVYIIASALCIEGWHWLRPRLERFDHWLDKKLHQNEHTAAILAVGKDSQRALSKWWADFKAVDDQESTK